MITINTEEALLDMTDMGVTLRTMLGHAAKGYETNPKRTWKLRYMGCIVGSVRLKTDRADTKAAKEKYDDNRFKRVESKVLSDTSTPDTKRAGDCSLTTKVEGPAP